MAEILDFIPVHRTRLDHHPKEESALTSATASRINCKYNRASAKIERSLLELAEAESRLMAALFVLEKAPNPSPATQRIIAAAKAALQHIQHAFSIVETLADEEEPASAG